MRVAEICLIFIPPRTAHKIVAVDNLKFVHFVAALRVEAEPIEIDCAVAQHVFWAGWSVN